jgi:hypothetical protein
MAEDPTPDIDSLMSSLAGNLAAQKFLLENMYTLLMASDDAPMRTLRATAKKSYEQFRDYIEAADKQGDLRRRGIAEHGLHHLEEFWLGVEGRMKKG